MLRSLFVIAMQKSLERARQERRLQIVWFKRDLRTVDHECLARASMQGPVLPLLVIEPDYWRLPETSWRQYEVIRAAAVSLQEELEAIGGQLSVWTGEMLGALNAAKSEFGSFDLWAHQETGNYWTFQRDRAVRHWCAANEILFTEPMQYGVWRGSSLDRDRWAKRWDRMMAQPIVPAPADTEWQAGGPAGFGVTIAGAHDIGLDHDGIADLQAAGRQPALATLQSFLHDRGRDYRTDMSSPLLGFDGCSRMSVHLVTGTVSMRECYQATQQRLDALVGVVGPDAKAWRASLSSFIGRLHWHCHFMQKLETEPAMEFRPVARAYEGLRCSASIEWYDAFAEGRTGYPFVDACMRSLRATGWINFRMRAMLMSFACYDLFMPWQQAGLILARLFTDYEPGIHWSQSQMQSGETGINTLRIYSPIKQGLDHDADGRFIRQWVPELRQLDDKAVHEPWRHGGAPGYPDPLVDHAVASAKARAAVWAIRKTDDARLEAASVLERHGSRRRPPQRSGGKSRAAR